MISLGLIILAFCEKFREIKLVKILSQFGSVPMFFYVLHLSVLLVIYKFCYIIYGPNQGEYFSLPNVESLWIIFIILSIALYFPTRWFAFHKHSNKNIKWLKYF